jgi:hypothetical protein
VKRFGTAAVARVQIETSAVSARFLGRIVPEEISRRTARPVIAVVLVCLTLAACGSTRRTVVVNPPPDSTTVVDRDGSATVIENR